MELEQLKNSCKGKQRNKQKRTNKQTNKTNLGYMPYLHLNVNNKANNYIYMYTTH